MSKRPSVKRRNLAELLVWVVAIVLLCYIVSFINLRVDLTAEKRHTLNPITKELLQGLDEVVFLRIYLDGDLPIGFKRMERALRETLEDFRVYGGRKFHFEFVDPLQSESPKERDALLRDLYERGLEPTNVQEVTPQGGRTQRIVIPGLIISHKGREEAVNLLRNMPGRSGEENINLSIQGFEHAMVSAIKRITQAEKPKIAFVHGHGQLDEVETGDIAQELLGQFQVHRVILGGEVGGLDSFSVVIMAGPREQVPEADKLVIDQYIMRGGRVLWLVDGVTISIDSLSKGATTLAFLNQHNLGDMLFRYGVRVNPTIVQDVQCAIIPINVSLAGQDPRFAPVPWLFYPLLTPPPDHPITRNLNLIKSQFISPLDTVGSSHGVRRQVLLRTSRHSRTLNAPVMVSLRQIERSPLERDFNRPHLPVALLMEGTFESVFSHRPLAGLNNGQPFDFRSTSLPTSMIVVGNSHIIRNEVSRRPDGAYITPLGWDRYTGQTYGNKELIVNMVNYLNDTQGLIHLRSRHIELRLLDSKRVLAERLKWQLINMIVPSALLIVGVIGWMLIRRRRYAR